MVVDLLFFEVGQALEYELISIIRSLHPEIEFHRPRVREEGPIRHRGFHVLGFVALPLSSSSTAPKIVASGLTTNNLIFVLSAQDSSLGLLRMLSLRYLTIPLESVVAATAFREALQDLAVVSSDQPRAANIIKSSTNRKLIVTIDEVSYIQGGGNYVTIHRRDGTKRTITRQLGDLLKTLPPQQFLRTHQSFIVNADHVNSLSEDGGLFVVLGSGVTVPLARRRRAKFKRSLKEYFAVSKLG